MRFIPLQIESRLRDRGFWPQSHMAWAALYVLALDFLVFGVQFFANRLWPSASASLGWWETFLDWLAITLLVILGFRWLRTHLLWRLRNRLIVTYVFIGVIPVILLVVISLITVYLFARQFAGFVVTSDVHTHLHSMEASNRAIGRALLNQLERQARLDPELIGPVRPRRPEWARREVCVWYGTESTANCTGPDGAPVFDFPRFIAEDFANLVRDHGKLYLRVATIIPSEKESLRVATSEPVDKDLVEQLTGGLGQIIFSSNAQSAVGTGLGAGESTAAPDSSASAESSSQAAQTAGSGQSTSTFSAGKVPPAVNSLDFQIAFPVPLQVVDWQSGERQREGALARIETRPSVLYARLFGVLGDYAKGIESILFSIAILFAIIEILALWVGTRLTRTITSSVADLYDATTHVNRGDFSHRIAVKSNDQLAALANSFNSMTTSIERLIKEQKEKQRLENELTIAQEVQSQLFPKEISQLASLEVHGFCRPARTVSGDYYDFLKLNPQKMILAVGDISGKGISAALLMATIHSAVRAYTIEGIPLLSEPAVAAGSGAGGLALIRDLPTRAESGPDVSPAALLGLLNHQLFESTPDAKYATLFLGIWDGSDGSLTYANGGHLHPILVSQDGSHRFLDCSGTVVGLLDNMEFPEATVHLRRGDLLIAYSDGVTEPESDYGEFGEERLIQIVRDNRHLPLERITPLVTAALDEWIGENEQPDDVTLVLARAR